MASNELVDAFLANVTAYVNAAAQPVDKPALLVYVTDQAAALRPPAEDPPTTAAEQAETTNPAAFAEQVFFQPDGTTVQGWQTGADLVGLPLDEFQLAMARSGAVSGNGTTLTMYRPERQTKLGRVLRELQD